MNHFTETLHKDSKETLVQIEDQFYKLVLVDITLKQIKALPFNQTPHIRFLNPIPQRTNIEQEAKNKESEIMHNFASQCSPQNNTVTSIKKAQKLGVDVSLEVKQLLEEKKLAKKNKDTKRVKEIRKLLRKLDYKRYKKGE